MRNCIVLVALSWCWLAGSLAWTQNQTPQPYATGYPQSYDPASVPMPPLSSGGGQPQVVVPPITFIDINSSSFGKLEIDLDDGQFMDGAVDKLHLVAKKLDLTQGLLAALNIDVKGGHFQDFIFDRLSISTQGALSFNTGTLLNHHMLEFTTPCLAQVNAVVSQNSLNKFVNSPNTLNRLSVAAMKKAAFLESLLGAGNNLITCTSGKVVLAPNNRMFISLETRLGIANIVLPLELDTQLSLKDGWIYFADTHLLTSGQEISPQLSKSVINKINGLAQWGQASDDIHFNFTNLKVIADDKFILEGTAEIRRLRFGNN